LIDAGPRSDRYNAGARRVVPFLLRHGARKLDALVLTHPHLDHIGGAAAVANVIEPRLVLDPDSGRMAEHDLADVARAAARERGQWLRARPGMHIRFDQLDLEVLHPTGVLLDASMDPNDYSVVLRLGYGKFSAVFMGDAPAAVEEALAARKGRQLDIDFLKVGHHGSSTSTSASWLALTTPRYAVISVGRGNRYGHPARSVLNRLDSAGVKTLRTDREGTISFRAFSDGRIERIERP
jgi:competence protein ComEC